jgi:hypothetical protein
MGRAAAPATVPADLEAGAPGAIDQAGRLSVEGRGEGVRIRALL